MTRREAIEILEEVKYNDDSMYAFSKAYCDALDMAIKALEAQGAKDPVYTAFYDIGGKNLSHYDCGACGAFLYSVAWFGSTLKDDRPKYCSRCGQAVKWDE